MRRYLVIFLMTLAPFALRATAQKPEPPIVFETLFGNERIGMTMSLNKPIAGKFRYNNITSTAVPYEFVPEKARLIELVSVNSIVYSLHRNIGVSGGMQYHFRKGFIPSIAVHLSYANPTWFLLLTPYYNFMPWSNVEVIAIAEYKPQLSEKLRLFSRLQGFYGHDFGKNEPERGMCYFRLGLSVQKYTFGLGGNIDFYRKTMPTVYNYGGFIRIDI